MSRLFYTSSHGLGKREEDKIVAPSSNHKTASSLSTEIKTKIANMGLTRVAGNVYICKSEQDFWKVSDNKIVRISSDEVDNGETLQSAPKDHPSAFLEEILGDLEF